MKYILGAGVIVWGHTLTQTKLHAELEIAIARLHLNIINAIIGYLKTTAGQQHVKDWVQTVQCCSEDFHQHHLNLHIP